MKIIFKICLFPFWLMGLGMAFIIFLLLCAVNVRTARTFMLGMTILFLESVGR